MKKKCIPCCAFLGLRALIAMRLCAAASLIAVGTVPAFLHPEASATVVAKRTLTFPERVSYQRAIEEVYWRHRIWPKENAGPKPPLNAVMSQAQLEKKVADYLLKSQLVTNQRGSPIIPSELQAEMERMGSRTKQPEVLRELFEAVGNDPFVVAECLAKPALVERLLTNLHSVRPGPEREIVERIPAVAGSYTLPTISGSGCSDDIWSPTSIVNAPAAREFHSAVWTGIEMIVWGGFTFSPPYRLNTGGTYDPTTDGWASTSLLNAAAGRDYHTAVWTGTEMIIWGGEGNGGPLRQVNTGGRYNPITDSWVATNTANAPAARAQHTAVWTGTEMIVWGGFSDPDTWFNSGGRYNPSTDSWTPTTTTNAPEARWAHTAVWTGSEMVIWGGTNQTISLNTGGRYNPTDDSWTATTTANAPLGRVGHTTVWSGNEMIVWGGTDSTSNDCNTGGRYNLANDSWVATSLANAPSARDSHAAVWTDTEMIIWGGAFCSPCVDFDTGGRYNAGTDSWTPTSTANAPLARVYHTAVWTGSEMIVWGGYNYPQHLVLNTGGRYCAQGGPSPTPTPTASPTPTPTATATPTATFTPTPVSTATGTATATSTPSSTPRSSPTPRIAPTPRSRPTPPPRP